MNKLFFLVLSLFTLNSLQAFWPFSGWSKSTPVQTTIFNSEQRDAMAKELNKVINDKDKIAAELERAKQDMVVATLKHIDEMQKKDAENAQLKKQVEYFANAYIVLCQTFKEGTLSLGFNKAFKALKNKLIALDSNPEITADMEIAAKNLNDAAKQTLSPFHNEFKSAHDQEIKNNLIAALNELKK